MAMGFFVGRELLVLLEHLAKGVQPAADQVSKLPAHTCIYIHIYIAHVRNGGIRTAGKGLEFMLLGLGLSTLAARAD